MGDKIKIKMKHGKAKMKLKLKDPTRIDADTASLLALALGPTRAALEAGKQASLPAAAEPAVHGEAEPRRTIEG